MTVKSNLTLTSALLVAFLNYMGMAIVFPLFAAMLFNDQVAFLPIDSTPEFRGVSLGILLAIMPLTQFFFSPILGAISDRRGRRPTLIMSLFIAALGYGVAVYAVHIESIALLAFTRIIIGISAGSTAVVQAAIADMSSTSNKQKNFGLYHMALGLGFTLGPLLGGILVIDNLYAAPFLFSFLMICINAMLVYLVFKETRIEKSLTPHKLSAKESLISLRKSLTIPALQGVMAATLIYSFGWSFFFEFMPVYLIKNFDFATDNLGLFYGYAGGLYALSSAVLIRPLARRFKPQKLFSASLLLTGASIALLLLVKSTQQFYLTFPPLILFVALVFPSATSLASDTAPEGTQGQTLGAMQSVQSLAFGIAPLVSGYIVGLNYHMPIFVGSASMFFAVLAYASLQKNKTL